MPTLRHESTITWILIPLMLAYILLQSVADLLLAPRRLLRATATCVRRDVQQTGLISLPSELLYRIVECVPLERPQDSSSPDSLLALSQ